MEWILCLGHAVLGLLLLPAASASPRTRRRAVELASGAGVLLGAGLVAAGQWDADPWRTVVFDSSSATPAGIVAAAAWLVTGALAGRSPRVEGAALTGVAATGLVLGVAGRYVVPALLFWLCSSLALAAIARSTSRWVVLAVSDAALCVGAIVHVASTDEWTWDGLEGGALIAVALAAVVRAGGFLTGPGGLTLVTGGGVALAAARFETPEPLLAVVFVVLAGAVAAVGLLRPAAGPAVVAAWSAALALALCAAAPEHAALAATAAALAVAACELWPSTEGRGGVARGLLVSSVPLTAGFGIVASGTAEAFALATGNGDDRALWTIAAVLLPAVFAGGVLAGARAARADGSGFVPEAVLATWVLLGAALATGIVPALVGATEPLGDSGGAFALQLFALAAGAGAGLFARRSSLQLERPGAGLVRAEVPAPVHLAPPARWAAAAVAASTIAAAGWLTVDGLRVGFL